MLQTKATEILKINWQDSSKLGAAAMVGLGTIAASFGLAPASAWVFYVACVLAVAVGLVLLQVATPIKWQDIALLDEGDSGGAVEMGGRHWVVERVNRPLPNFIWAGAMGILAIGWLLDFWVVIHGGALPAGTFASVTVSNLLCGFFAFPWLSRGNGFLLFLQASGERKILFVRGKVVFGKKL